MRFSRVELPGEVPVDLTTGLNILGGLDAPARRRWLDVLTGTVPARIWLEDSDAPAADLGLSPAVVEAMVVRGEDLTLMPAPAPPPAAPTPTARSGVPDPSPVVAALAAWREAIAIAGGHAEEVAELATEWEQLSARLAAEPALARDDQDKIDAARQNRDRALETLAQARKAYGGAALAPETMAVAHRLHDEVMAAQEHASRRFAGPKARARLTAALEEETEFLATMGVSSYTAFLLEVVDRPTDPEIARRVQEAEKEAQEAEATWRALGTLGAQARERADLERRLEALHERAGELLDVRADGDLAALVRTWPAGVPEVEATRQALEAALRTVGVDPGPDPASTASDWLAARSERTEDEQGEEGSEAGPEDSPRAAHAPNADPEAIERYLLGRLEAQNRYGESFPLVFDDALEGLPEPVLDRALAVLQQASASLQIIYLTADSDDQAVDVTDRPAEASIAAPGPETATERDTVTPEHFVPVAPVAPARVAVAEQGPEATAGAPKLAWCKPGSHHTVAEACCRCRQPVCDDHLVRTRTAFPSLCPPCALAVAGVARGRRRR